MHAKNDERFLTVLAVFAVRSRRTRAALLISVARAAVVAHVFAADVCRAELSVGVEEVTILTVAVRVYVTGSRYITT